jgi:hypothetical protein
MGAPLFSAGAGSFAKALPEAPDLAWRIFCHGKKAKTVTEKRDTPHIPPGAAFCDDAKNGTSPNWQGRSEGHGPKRGGPAEWVCAFCGGGAKSPETRH